MDQHQPNRAIRRKAARASAKIRRKQRQLAEDHARKTVEEGPALNIDDVEHDLFTVLEFLAAKLDEIQIASSMGQPHPEALYRKVDTSKPDIVGVDGRKLGQAEVVLAGMKIEADAIASVVMSYRQLKALRAGPWLEPGWMDRIDEVDDEEGP